MKNTGFHVKILLMKCYTEKMKKLVKKNVMPLFGAASAAPNKDTTIFFLSI